MVKILIHWVWIQIPEKYKDDIQKRNYLFLQVVYSFSNNNLDQTTCSTSMLIIKRIRQTVRARSMINGYEKWIFR